MSFQPESSDRTATVTQAEAKSPGVQLTELLVKFGEMATEMAAYKKLIDELISSGVQPEPIPSKQPESDPFIIPSVQTTLEENFNHITTNPTYPPFYPYYPRPHPVYNININYPPPRPNYASPHTPPFQISPPNLYQNRPRPSYNPRIPPPNRPIYNYPQTPKANNPGRNRPFTNLDKPLDQVYEQLKAVGEINMIPPPTYPFGIPVGYNPQAYCAYHSGAPGHSTIECKALKHKIQDMIEAKEIVVEKGSV